MTSALAPAERRETFACFGSSCTVIVADAGDREAAGVSVTRAKRRLLDWHHQFSRFEPDSELSRLNADPRGTVPVTSMMHRIIETSVRCSQLTDGLVDATLVEEIERLGYATHFEQPGLALAAALSLAPARAAARPHSSGRWQQIRPDRRTGTVTRPPGVRLDPGGVAKGVFADELGTVLGRYDAYAVDCAGDLRLGGRSRLQRAVHVESPFDGSILHTFELVDGGVATSGIGRRSWLRDDGQPAHHLIDPRSGRPAFTGIVQATALAPTAAEAEARSKAALLSGPRQADRWLPYGGVIVLDDGGNRLITP